MDPRLSHLTWAHSLASRLRGACGCARCLDIADLVDAWAAAVADARPAPVDLGRVGAWHRVGWAWPDETLGDTVVRSLLLRSSAVESYGYRLDGWADPDADADDSISLDDD